MGAGALRGKDLPTTTVDEGQKASVNTTLPEPVVGQGIPNVGFRDSERVGFMDSERIGFLDSERAGGAKRSLGLSDPKAAHVLVPPTAAESSAAGATSDAPAGAAALITVDPEHHQTVDLLEQRKRRQAKKKKGHKAKDTFLSTVPDLSFDVQYRFTIYVVGDIAGKIIEAACSNEDALAKQAYASEVSAPERDASTTSWSVISASPSKVGSDTTEHSDNSGERHPTEHSEDCPTPLPSDAGAVPYWNSQTSQVHLSSFICPVPYPTEVRCEKYAKVKFEALSFNSSVPKCRSAADASGTVLVFCITVDPPTGAPFLENQLLALLDVLQERRRTKKKYRPAWAVLLCHSQEHGSTEQEDAKPAWTNKIEEFEREHGALWRFGAVGCQNGEMLYSVFAKIASHRIYVSENPGSVSRESPEDMQEYEEGSDADEGSEKSDGCMWGAAGCESQTSSSYGTSHNSGPPASNSFPGTFTDMLPSESALAGHPSSS